MFAIHVCLCASVCLCVSVCLLICIGKKCRAVVICFAEKGGGRGRKYGAERDAWAGLHLGLLFWTALSLQVQCVCLCCGVDETLLPPSLSDC